jgi:hypothetical protein
MNNFKRPVIGRLEFHEAHFFAKDMTFLEQSQRILQSMLHILAFDYGYIEEFRANMNLYQMKLV